MRISILLTILTVIISCSKTELHKHKHGWGNDKAAFAYTAFALANPVNKKIKLNNLRYQSFSVDENFLKEKLSEFSGAKTFFINKEETRISERKSKAGEKLAIAYLEKEFSRYGYKTSRHKYGFLTKRENFIAELEGKDPSKVLIISAHIDSVGNAGANDDGSGVISMLAIAKALKDFDFKYTLRFVGFSGEEIGLVGSRYYVKSIKNKKSIIGNIQLEMMATNSRKDGAFHVIDCDKKNSLFLSQHLLSSISDLSIDLQNVPACTSASDHSNFWKAKIPSIVLSENFFGGDGDPCYHKKCDVVDDRIDFGYMAKITNAVASTVEAILR